MTQCIVQEAGGTARLLLQGRLDSMTSPAVQQQVEELIAGGRRLLVADLSGLGFVSSAGLRIFMIAQKSLKKAGGEIVLFRVPEAIRQVFTMSGFEALFRQCSSEQELAAYLAGRHAAAAARHEVACGVRFSLLQAAGKPGACFPVGSQEKLPGSRYELPDSLPVRQSDMRFGAGLAAAGQEYDDYKELFGEAVVLDGSLFFYPAVRHAAVDYILCAAADPSVKYRFFHGFGFNGDLALTAAFEGVDGFPTLQDLVGGALTLTQAQAVGIVLLAESKGLLGMNLKKSPIVENRPANGLPIFDAANFAEWMNFPIEPADVNAVVAAAGIAVSSREGLPSKYVRLLPADSLHHVHAGVFSGAPLSKDPASFPAELRRVTRELACTKVQHLLGESKFSNGLVGIVELG
jgi:anti-anti-sigma factor